MTTVAAIACFNFNEAWYAWNAVLVPYTAEDGPCPTGTRLNDASGMKISTSKHIALREVTTKLSTRRAVASTLYNQLVSFFTIHYHKSAFFESFPSDNRSHRSE